MALVTLAEAKVYLGISGSGEDDWLTQAVEWVSAQAARYCHRPSFDVYANEIEYVDGGGESEFYLSRPNVTGIASIYDDLERDFTADTLISSDDYGFTAAGRVYLKPFVEIGATTSKRTHFQDGPENVKVTYSGGYTAGSDVPSDLQLAAFSLIDKIRAKVGKVGLSGFSAGSYSVQFQALALSNGGLPSEVVALLEDWRIRGL